MEHDVLDSRGPSRLRRGAECAAFVGVWAALGKILRLSPEPYLLIGVPLTLAFQRWIARSPLLSLWVRDAPRFRLDRLGGAFAVTLALVPGWLLVRAIQAGKATTIAWSVAALAGAPAAAFAIRTLFSRDPRKGVRQMLGCLATAGGIGMLPSLAAVYSAVKKGHVLAGPWLGVEHFLLFVPVCFVLEEVSFRGALDAHLHRPGERRGWLSALWISALWGLWHVPVMGTLDRAEGAGIAVTAIPMMVVFACMVGVPLSIFWRKSGNLLVPSLTHALVDAVRDVALTGLRG